MVQRRNEARKSLSYRLVRRATGAALISYALLAGLIVVAAVATVRRTGDEIASAYSGTAMALSDRGLAQHGGVDAPTPGFTLATGALPVATLGETYSFDFASRVSGLDAGALTWSFADGAAAPTGLSLDGGTGALSGTPGSEDDPALEIVATGPDGASRGGVFALRVDDTVLEATDVVSGRRHSCAITPTDRVACWGDNGVGQLGNPDVAGGSATPVMVALDPAITPEKIVSGRYHTCILSASSGVRCWGGNGRYQLGNNGAASTGAPVTPVGLGAGGVVVDDIAAGHYHSCVAARDGALMCWGGNGESQIGDGASQDVATPKVIDFGTGAAADLVTAGRFHSCVSSEEMGVYCWGANGNGQLGTGSTSPDPERTPVRASQVPATVAEMDSGAYHTCARLEDASMECWGNGSNGQLGRAGASYSASSEQVEGMASGVSAISVAGNFSCAVQGGTAKCWGGEEDGNAQLGNGANGSSETPVAVDLGGMSVTGLGVGESHGCVVTSDGLARCWGGNGYGQIGDDSTAVRESPVKVANGEQKI